MIGFKGLTKLTLAASVLLSTMAMSTGTTLAADGSVGRHSDRGVKCYFDELDVNAPQVYAFDATTAVDTQTVYWTPELWRLDPASGQYVLDLAYGEWIATEVDDGTEMDYMIIGGERIFHINVPGTYRVAIRYYWAATTNAPAGEAYEWVGSYYQSEWSYWLGTDVAASDGCGFMG